MSSDEIRPTLTWETLVEKLETTFGSAEVAWQYLEGLSAGMTPRQELAARFVEARVRSTRGTPNDQSVARAFVLADLILQGGKVCPTEKEEADG